MPPNVVKASDLRANTRMADPDVKIPAAVTRAKEAAEAAQRAAYPDQVPPTPPTDAPPPADGIVIADAPLVATPPTPPAPQLPAPLAQPAPVTPLGNDDTWEHKFNSERGRHQRTQTLLQDTTNRLSALEQLVADIQATPAPAAPAPVPSRLVTEQEVNEFGTEMIDVMGRRAREAVAPEVAELRNKLVALEGKLNGTTQVVTRNARQDMLTQLTRDLPNWRQVNELAEFKAWLALPDPYFGVIRHTELLKAFEQNDTPRVLQFFKGFVSELAATTPADDPLLVTPAAVQPTKPGLEALAAPGRARTPAQQQTPAEKQIITTADVNAFYDASRRGLYRGREEEFRRLEEELFLAQREGRVRAV